MNCCSTSSWLRLWLARAIDSSASACFTCASGSWSSSCTSSCPRRTRSASRKLIFVTRPDTSGRSITLWRERRLPTVAVSSVTRCSSTRATSTDGTRVEPFGAGAPAGAPAPGVAAAGSLGRCGCCWYHQAPPEAAAITTAATTVWRDFNAM
jgi:hypothetical protein